VLSPSKKWVRLKKKVANGEIGSAHKEQKKNPNVRSLSVPLSVKCEIIDRIRLMKGFMSSILINDSDERVASGFVLLILHNSGKFGGRKMCVLAITFGCLTLVKKIKKMRIKGVTRVFHR